MSQGWNSSLFRPLASHLILLASSTERRYNVNVSFMNLQTQVSWSQKAFPLILTKSWDTAAFLDAPQPAFNLSFKHHQTSSAAQSEFLSLFYIFSFSTIPWGLILSLMHSQIFSSICSQMVWKRVRRIRGKTAPFLLSEKKLLLFWRKMQ